MTCRRVLNGTAAAMAILAVFALACGDEAPITQVTNNNVIGESVYGNGSAGARNYTASAPWDEDNPQFTNFVIGTGVTLTIPSGTVIRCTGTFTNNGTIVVETCALGSVHEGHLSTTDNAYAPAEAGVSLRAASPGELGDNTNDRAGGFGGVGVSEAVARNILRPGPKAGGGSGGAGVTDGAAGGGSIVILAKEAVINNGEIGADGADGASRAGGGGGGIVILASAGTVENNGSVHVDGGDGGPSDTFAGAGGGGGGGFLHFLAPTLVLGVRSVGGGSAGTVTGAVTNSPRQGGGGGGACGGSGGNGSTVTALNNASPAQNGVLGIAMITHDDGGALFLNREAR